MTPCYRRYEMKKILHLVFLAVIIFFSGPAYADKKSSKLERQLIQAAEYGDKSGVQRFSAAIRKYSVEMELREAAAKGDVDSVELILDQSTDVYENSLEVLKMASEEGDTELVKIILGIGIPEIDDGKEQALQWSAAKGQHDTVKALLKDGADVHAGKDLALRKAAESGHTKTVKLLLEHNANVNAKNDGALQASTGSGHTKTVKLLLENGANIHARHDGPLYAAANNGDPLLIKLLRTTLEKENPSNPLAMSILLKTHKKHSASFDDIVKSVSANRVAAGLDRPITGQTMENDDPACTTIEKCLPMAKQGLARAHYNLGVIYAKGQGVPENSVEAYSWFFISAVQGVKLAPVFRDRVAKKLSPDDLSKGYKRAIEHYRNYVEPYH